MLLIYCICFTALCESPFMPGTSRLPLQGRLPGPSGRSFGAYFIPRKHIQQDSGEEAFSRKSYLSLSLISLNREAWYIKHFAGLGSINFTKSSCLLMVRNRSIRQSRFIRICVLFHFHISVRLCDVKLEILSF